MELLAVGGASLVWNPRHRVSIAAAHCNCKSFGEITTVRRRWNPFGVDKRGGSGVAAKQTLVEARGFNAQAVSNAASEAIPSSTDKRHRIMATRKEYQRNVSRLATENGNVVDRETSQPGGMVVTPRQTGRQVVENTEEVSASDESSEDPSNAKLGARRRGRSSAKRGVAKKSKTNTKSKPLKNEQLEVAQETTTIDVGSPEKLSAPSVSRSRSKKKATPAEQQTESKVTTEGSNVNDRILTSSTAEGVSSSSSLIGEDEHIHRLGISVELPSETGDFRVEPERSTKSVRPRKKAGKVAVNVKVSEDDGLQVRVQESATSSGDGSVEIHERRTVSEEIANEGLEAGLIPPESDVHTSNVEVKKKRQRKARKKQVEVADTDDSILDKAAVAQSVLVDDTTSSDSKEDEAANSSDGDSPLHNPGSEVSPPPKTIPPEPDVHTSNVEVKKKRRRKARKKQVAVADTDDSILDKAAVAQSVLVDDTTISDSKEDEATNSSDGDSPLHNPGSEVSPPPKMRTRRRRRQGDAVQQVSEGEGSDSPSESNASVMSNMFSIGASMNGGAGGSPQGGAILNGTQIDTDGGVGEATATARVQFPAPTWGPQWWDEIQSKSQPSISFQDIAERREGFQVRPKVSQETVPEDGEVIDVLEPADKKAEVIKSVEQTKEVNEANTDVLNAENTLIRRQEGLKMSGRRIAKANPALKVSQESYEQWLKKKMLSLGKPTEEPWLLESMIAAEAERELSGDTRLAPKQEVNEVPATIEEPRRVVSPSPETGDLKKEPEVEVEILINTSECTMQRMAILENKKLVEFSIEPVNTKVQVGNIYLGRVKQLLPGMSGVFVDIGGSRLALLDIARNQYPYTFPPVFASENFVFNNSDNGALVEDEDQALSEVDLDCIEEEDDADEDEESHDELVKNIEADGAAVEKAVDVDDVQDEHEEPRIVPKAWRPHKQGGPITVNFGRKFSKWRNVEVGMPIIVQVKKESMGKKGPRLTAFPTLAGRFWVLIPRGNAVGVSARITGPERRRLKLLAQSLRPQDLGITVRTEATGHEQEELERDLTRLIDTWKEITEKAASAALAVVRGEEAAVPVLLHREMGQTLSIIRDLFTEKISRLVVDSSQSYQSVINYLQEVAPHLMNRVVLYSGKVPIFDKFNVEVDLDRFSSERVKLPNGGYLVMQETEALVSIDVNGGTGMLGHTTRQREAILEVNIAAARRIASEIRLRDIGGIIVVDFIDMDYAEDERLVHEEMRKAIQRDRSKVSISEISDFGLMEMTRKRVRSSVTLTIHSPCNSCKGTGRVEALETTLSKIERAIRRLLAEHPDVEEQRSSDASTWPQVVLRVEPSMLEFLKSWKKKRIVQLGHFLKVWISLKAGMELSRGQFEVTQRVNKKTPAAGSHGSHKSSSLQHQEKAVTAPVLGKRVWPKRKRHFA